MSEPETALKKLNLHDEEISLHRGSIIITVNSSDPNVEQYNNKDAAQLTPLKFACVPILPVLPFRRDRLSSIVAVKLRPRRGDLRRFQA